MLAGPIESTAHAIAAVKAQVRAKSTKANDEQCADTAMPRSRLRRGKITPHHRATRLRSRCPMRPPALSSLGVDANHDEPQVSNTSAMEASCVGEEPCAERAEEGHRQLLPASSRSQDSGQEGWT